MPTADKPDLAALRALAHTYELNELISGYWAMRNALPYLLRCAELIEHADMITWGEWSGCETGEHSSRLECLEADLAEYKEEQDAIADSGEGGNA